MSLLHAASFALSASLLSLAIVDPAGQDPRLYPIASRSHGASYAEWSARWWAWYMQQPVAGHPGLDDGLFDVTAGQTGNVWFLAAPLDFGAAVPRSRTVTIPAGTSLFIGLVNAEMSSQEGVPDVASQRAIANFLADHVTSATCAIDGVDVGDLADHRFESPQFSFTAPTPWIFGPAGEGDAGTSVGDGYYVFVRPLGVGTHTIQYTGSLHFDAGELGPDAFDLALDMTYVVHVAP